MELHVEHFVCSCTKWANDWCVHLQICAQKHTFFHQRIGCAYAYIHEFNELLPHSHDNHSAW